MERSEAYWILHNMWDKANEEQREALSIAQRDIEFVDLMDDRFLPVKHGRWVKDKDGDEWRDAKTDPPKEDGEYIVHVRNLSGYWQMKSPVFVAEYFKGDWIFQGWEDNEVTHWQPLPELPKENG